MIKLTREIALIAAVSDLSIFFDIENGIFKNLHDSNYCVGGELVNEFKKLLGINFDQYYEILKTTNQRRNMTNLSLIHI